MACRTIFKLDVVTFEYINIHSTEYDYIKYPHSVQRYTICQVTGAIDTVSVQNGISEKLIAELHIVHLFLKKPNI